MNINFSRKKIAEGIHFTEIINKRQKANAFAVHFVTSLSEDTASLNAVIPYVLSNSSSEFGTLTELSIKLASLYGAGIRGMVTKHGDSQVVSLTASCINDRYTFDGEEITKETARVLAGCIISPRTENGGFYEKDFLLKKQELLDDIDAEINDKRSFAFKRSSGVIYRNEPCAVPVKGNRSSAEAINAVSAYEQYKKLLKTSQIEIIYAGASEAGEAGNTLCSAISGLEREYAGDNSSLFSPVKSEPEYVSESHDVVQSKMVMAFKSSCDDPTAMRLMSTVFGGTPFSKLFMNVREKLSLCYYCSSGYNDRKGVLLVDSGVEHSNVKKAEEEILNQLKAVQNGDFTDEELSNSRLYIINALRGVTDGLRSISDWYFRQSYAGKSLSPEDEIEKVGAVSREDIINAAKSLTLDTVYVLTGKESDGTL